MPASTTTPVSLVTSQLALLKQLEWRVRHAVENVLSGEYRSAFRGRGMEFDQVRKSQVDGLETFRQGGVLVENLKAQLVRPPVAVGPGGSRVRDRALAGAGVGLCVHDLVLPFSGTGGPD